MWLFVHDSRWFVTCEIIECGKFRFKFEKLLFSFINAKFNFSISFEVLTDPQKTMLIVLSLKFTSKSICSSFTEGSFITCLLYCLFLLSHLEIFLYPPIINEDGPKIVSEIAQTMTLTCSLITIFLPLKFILLFRSTITSQLLFSIYPLFHFTSLILFGGFWIVDSWYCRFQFKRLLLFWLFYLIKLRFLFLS